MCDEPHLRDALAGGGLVTFACSGVIALTTEITILADTTIDGVGQDVTISGNEAVRVFTVTPGRTLMLNRLTIAGGAADKGGGIYVPPCYIDCGNTTVAIDSSTFSDNSASSRGGAIFLSTYCEEDCGPVAVTVTNSAFSENSASSYGGGAIYHDSDPYPQDVAVIVNNSVFSHNAGGAIVVGNHARLAVSDSAFSGNSGDAISNALYSIPTIRVSHSTFSGNSGHGIRIREWSNVSVSDSIFDDNGRCGIDNWDSTMTIRNSAFSGNADCGIGNGDDGGIMTVLNSTFTGNGEAGDDIITGVQGTTTVANSTFADIDGSHGGGISNIAESTMTVSNSTFYGVPLINGVYESTLTLRNTIVAYSSSGSNCTGDITDGGGNLSFPDSTCPGINSDPMLGPLQNNGGPTETMAPGPGSPAIDAGDDATCAAPPVNNLDQRGIARSWHPHCDIGAVEQEPPTFTRRWLPIMPIR